MTIKKDLYVKALAEALQTTQKDAAEIANIVFEVAEELVIEHKDALKLGDLLTIKPKQVEEKTYPVRDMKKDSPTKGQVIGETVKPAHTGVTITPTKGFKDRLAQA